MGDEVVVKTASVSLTAAIATVTAFTPTHTLLLAPSEKFASSEGNEMLLESDVDSSFATYVSPYVNAPYIGGTLIYKSLKSISNLSELTKKDGEFVVTKKTEGTIECSAAGGTDPGSGSPDSNTSYDFDFTISDAGQTLTLSD